MSGNRIISLIKNSDNRTIGANIFWNGANIERSIYDIVSSGAKFDNAVVCKNGVIRGKDCSLPVVYKENKIIVYHGSYIKSFTPTFGLGEDKHDYGRGFYTTRNKELACEWAKIAEDKVSYLHTYELNCDGLKVFNFNNVSSLAWLAELMSHRDADNSARYKRLSKQFIAMYKIDISDYDIIYGWRADSSYFHIAKRFVRNEIDVSLIRELFMLGDLDNQVCIKSKLAFSRLKEKFPVEVVDDSYNVKYVERDMNARLKMQQLIESNRNTMKYGFDYCLERKMNI